MASATRPPGVPPTGTFVPGTPFSLELVTETMSSMIAMATTSIGTTAVSTALPLNSNGSTAGSGTATMSAASIVSVSTVFMFAATTAYLLRMLQPPCRKLEYIIGQVVITIAFLLLVTVYSLTIKVARVSVGELDLIELNRYGYLIDAVTNAQLVFTKLSFALSILSFSKLSKNLQYQRIVKGVVLFQTLYLLSVLPHDILCLPLSDIWEVVQAIGGSSTSTKVTHCQNFFISFYVFGTIELLNDIILLLLPIPVIASLPGKHYRYGTIFLFALGICVLFADILKLIFIPYVGHTHHSSDKLHSNSRLVWSFVGNHMKSYISLIVACLPQVRVTLVQLFTSRRRQATNRATAEEAGSQSPKTGLEKYTFSTSYTDMEDGADVSCDVVSVKQREMSQKPEAGEMTDQLRRDSNILTKNHVELHIEPLASCSKNSRRSSELHKAFTDALQRRLTFQAPLDTAVVAAAGSTGLTNSDAERGLCPSSAVQIKAFNQQIVRTSRSPESHPMEFVTRPALTRSPSQEIIGRSTLQKEYFDLVVQQRKQSNNSQILADMDRDMSLDRQVAEASDDLANHGRYMAQPIDSPTWGAEAPVFDDKARY